MGAGEDHFCDRMFIPPRRCNSYKCGIYNTFPNYMKQTQTVQTREMSNEAKVYGDFV